MNRRYFSATPIQGEHATLADAEAHHLLHVLRASPGTEVTLFDGSGAEFAARVTACGRSTVDLEVGERCEVNHELPFMFTLGVPLPKGDRQRWIVEKATELGVTRLVPLVVERSQPNAAERGDKLERYVIEASKQCGRNRLMEIAAPSTWTSWLEEPDAATNARRLIAHPGGKLIRLAEVDRSSPTFAAVGPEGGFTDDEIAKAIERGWEIVGLGERILRIETAAVSLAALVSHGGA